MESERERMCERGVNEEHRVLQRFNNVNELLLLAISQQLIKGGTEMKGSFNLEKRAAAKR